MDKYEYKVRAEEIKALIAEGEFAEAVKIADTIDWRRVKSVMMLCTISDLYKINRRFQESKDILLMAYERHPGGRLIVYSLCELSIKMGEFVQAVEYYKEFVQIAPKDTGRYILQYKLYEAQDVSLEERIAVLEEFKKRDYREKWAYELAYLYHRVGLETKCVEECDEMILWFGEGRYVLKALELKLLHQPLSASQQEKYQLMKQQLEQLMTGEEQPEEENAQEPVQEEEQPESEPVSAEYEQVPQPAEEEDFRVKTVDLGQYNTINLQQALAESMREILAEEEQPESEAEQSSMGAVTESIVAPLLQETGEILETQNADFVPLEEPEVQQDEPEQLQMPEAPIATEEVFFEEDVKDILLEDTKKVNVINIGDTKEIQPKRRVIYPTTSPSRLVGGAVMPVQRPPVDEVTQEAAAKEAMPEAAGSVQSAGTAAEVQAQGPVLLKTVKPSGFEQMLSQEYDGQISLVVPSRSDIEKQITGQMNINDIMAEWERMKRENEEKRREDVRKRVQQHTGNMFSEFDEATKTGLLEQMEKAVVEAILKESGQNAVQPDKLTAEQLTDIVKKVERKEKTAAASNVVEGIKNMDQAAKMVVNQFSQMPVIEEIEETNEGTAVPDRQDTESGEEMQTAGGQADPEIQKDEAEAVTQESAAGEPADAAIVNIGQLVSQSHGEQENGKDTVKLRAFTDEEKELFGRFAHSRKAREQIIHAVDTISMDSYSGNVVITGEEEAGTLELAKNLVRMLQMTDRNFSGKVAKISGDTLNKKDVGATLEKLADGALIIEHATQMASGTSADLSKALAKEDKGIFVIMEGKKDEINIFLRKNHALMNNFNARIDIESLNDQALVEYARQYAEEMEYSIDELGILALHTRIADMQTSDHEVTVAEVRDLVDDAIYFADKKNPTHFFDILFGKRYDEEDMIVLREKDFMHY